MTPLPSVTYRSKTYAIVGLFLMAGLVAWLSRHAALIVQGEGANPLYSVMSLVFVAFLGLAWLERPHRATAEQRTELDKLVVSVNVPLYNEDPVIARQVLESFLVQTRKPNRVQVVDDGSSVDYTELAQWWPVAAAEAGIEGTWVRTANGGKRAAQLTTFRHDHSADVFLTVDSDSVLAANAIEEGLLPLANPKVSSVAAVVVAMNAKTNMVTRLTDMMFLNFQLVTRSGLSTLKSVLVNSGCLSFYRASVVREVMDSYEAEVFAGRGVQFSDDSFLTLAAYMKGQTVQQMSSVAFTYLPEKVSHHLRQQLRWARGSTIRSIWRFRYLPMHRAAYWVHLVNWANFVLVGAVLVYLLAPEPLATGELAPWVFGISAAIAYATSLRYLTVKRSDISLRWQLATFLMAPALMAWSALVLRPLRLYGMATCWNTGWGTRQHGAEIAMEVAA